jgi:hypothetical protein
MFRQPAGPDHVRGWLAGPIRSRKQEENMRRMLSMLLLLTAASIAVPATNALASAAPGLQQQFGVRLFDVPVAAAHNPRALRYIIDFVHPGSVIRRRILVLNQETRRAHFAVYPDAARITRGLFVGDSGATRSELTNWTRLQHRTLTLSPGASTLDMVTIRIPRGATRGEHYGVIWVQQAARARTASGTAIKEVNRVGIRIYLDVGRGGAPPTRFVITSLAGHRSPGGQPVVVAHVHDTGGLAVDLSGQLRLSDGPGGITAGPFLEQQVVTLAPGQSGNLVFAESKNLPGGSWHAAVRLVSGITTATAQSDIQFPGGHGTSAWTRLSPFWALAVAIGLLTLALILRRGRPRVAASRRRSAGARRRLNIPRGSHGLGG